MGAPRLLPAPRPTTPCWAGSHCCLLPTWTPGKAGSSAQTCRTTTAHGLTSSLPAPSPARGQPPLGPPPQGGLEGPPRTAGEPGARLGSLSSPAGQPPASPSRGTSSRPLPPHSCPRGWSPSSWRHLQGQGDAGGALCLVADTEGTREGRELRFGARRTPRRPLVAQGGFMLARRPPPQHTYTLEHTHSRTLAVPEDTLTPCGSGRRRVKPSPGRALSR